MFFRIFTFRDIDGLQCCLLGSGKQDLLLQMFDMIHTSNYMLNEQITFHWFA